MAVSICSELNALVELSADLGRNKLLVQASTGNTSLKTGSTLWIKASGKWLRDAADEEIFVPVDRGEIDKYLSGELPQPGSMAGSVLKPSIETAMHLVLPHRVVIHVHSVNAIAWAVQRDPLANLRQRLDALRWAWIPYTPSGGALAAQIRTSLRFSPDVFILANHGLVIGADSCEEAVVLLREVEERLALAPRPMPAPDLTKLEQLARSSKFRIPEAEIIHLLASDELSNAIVSGGVLYPCQAIFLGRRTPVITNQDFIFRRIHESQSQNGFRPPALLVQGQGVLVAEDITPSESEMLIGLAQVARRLHSDSRIAYLSEQSVDQLLDNCVYGALQRPSMLSAMAATAGCDDSSRTA